MQILHVLDDVHYSISIDEIIYKFSVDKIILPEINQFENNFYKDRRVKYTRIIYLFLVPLHVVNTLVFSIENWLYVPTMTHLPPPPLGPLDIVITDTRVIQKQTHIHRNY